ncbi:MAG: ribonuclease III [Actinomycetia bacterium]|nr:ribonuclease III [Actinomycetes bacterium]
MEEEGTLRKRIRTWLKTIGIDTEDLKVYIQSLTHRSFAREINVESRGNEQLEFMGDSIISFVLTSYLYENYGNYTEGKLAKIRAILVNMKTLAILAREIGIDKQILLSENEESCQGREKDSILADSFEAFVGAIYIDQGIEFTRKWLLERFEDRIEERILRPKISDYKTYLQEAVQADYAKLVKYRLIKADGPDHNKLFYSVSMIEEKIIGRGKGKSKKKSEQEAARDALSTLYNLKK